MRAYFLITCAFFLTACSTPQVNPPPPSSVTLAEDLHFKWYPPNSGLEWEIFISAGHYARSADDGNIVYYELETGLVSKVRAGHPAEKVRGGIAYLKKKGRYFVWEVAPSYNVRYPLNGLADEIHDGPLIKIFLGQVPTEIEPNLRFEQ